MELSVSEVPLTFADKTDAGLGQWKNSVWYKWQETWSFDYKRDIEYISGRERMSKTKAAEAALL